MIRILANDGIDESGKNLLETAGFFVQTDHIPQEELPLRLNNFDVILVRSATKVRKELIDQNPGLKLIGRGGVGMDNIDVEYALSKNIEVINTPAASSISVAELVFAHLYSGCRMLSLTQRRMPDFGKTEFKDLKKKASKGIELKGKTLGIIGIGRIGSEVAKIALGSGMNVMAYDPYIDEVNIRLQFHQDTLLPDMNLKLSTCGLDDLLSNSDFITLHLPGGKGTLLGKDELAKMKKGAGIVNCARGGIIDESALAQALESGALSFAGIDVFENEPPVNDIMLKAKNTSLSPHIGAATMEAQNRVGIELAEKIIQFFN